MTGQSVIRIVEILRGSENSLKSVDSKKCGFYHPFQVDGKFCKRNESEMLNFTVHFKVLDDVMSNCGIKFCTAIFGQQDTMQ